MSCTRGGPTSGSRIWGSFMRKPNPFRINRLRTQFFPSPLFSCDCAFRGEGGTPISKPCHIMTFQTHDRRTNQHACAEEPCPGGCRMASAQGRKRAGAQPLPLSGSTTRVAAPPPPRRFSWRATSHRRPVAGRRSRFNRDQSRATSLPAGFLGGSPPTGPCDHLEHSVECPRP